LSVGWGLDGQTLYTVSTDDVIRIWNTENSTLQKEFFLDYGVAAATTNIDATKLAIADYESRIRIYEAESAVLLSELETLPLLSTRGSILDLTWSPDGSQIGGSDSDGIYIWDISTGSLFNTFPVQHAGGGLSVIAFHPDGYFTYPDENGNAVDVRAADIHAPVSSDQPRFDKRSGYTRN
jgi:WD40 repeat protein